MREEQHIRCVQPNHVGPYRQEREPRKEMENEKPGKEINGGLGVWFSGR